VRLLRKKLFDRFYFKWVLLLSALIFLAPVFGFLKDKLGSVEPLDHVANSLGLEENNPFFEIFPDYTVPFISNPFVSNIIAGFIGFILVFCASYLIAKLLARRE